MIYYIQLLYHYLHTGSYEEKITVRRVPQQKQTTRNKKTAAYACPRSFIKKTASTCGQKINFQVNEINEHQGL